MMIFPGDEPLCLVEVCSRVLVEWPETEAVMLDCAPFSSRNVDGFAPELRKQHSREILPAKQATLDLDLREF